MDKANTHLSEIAGVPKSLKSVFGLRFQLFNFMFKSLLQLPLSYNPYFPGLEMKYACEEARRCNAKLVFLGPEFNDNTVNQIKHEKRFTLLSFIRRLYSLRQAYKKESIEFSARVDQRGVVSFIESSLDAKNINWVYKLMEIVAPEYKRIFVDKKDEELFKAIIANKGKKMVAVVNQHHIEGIEHHWCNSYGTVPTFNNDFPLETINPIADMPIRQMLYNQMYHVIKREIKSSRSKASPASFTNEISVYHREFNHQYEHRNM